MIGEPLNKLYKGELSFDAFVLQTRGYWENLARRLIYKWNAPPSVSVDDLIQEMFIKCWDLLATYDPNKSPLEKYIVYNAMNHAKRYLHKQRGAKHYRDKSPSRYPLLYDDLDKLSESYYMAPDQEQFIQRLEKVDLASNVKEMLILYKLARIPSIDIVASDLYSNPNIRLAMQLNSLPDTRRIVYRSVLKISRAVKHNNDLLLTLERDPEHG